MKDEDIHGPSLPVEQFSDHNTTNSACGPRHDYSIWSSNWKMTTSFTFFFFFELSICWCWPLQIYILVPVRDIWPLFLHLLWLNKAVQTHIINDFNYSPYQSISHRSIYFYFWYRQITQNSVLIFWHDFCQYFSVQH